MNRSYPALAARILLLLSVSPVVAQTPDTPAICLPGPDFFKGLFFGVILGFTVAGLFFRRPFSGQSQATPAADSAENPVTVLDSVPETAADQNPDASTDPNSEAMTNSVSESAADAASVVESPAVPAFVSDATKREKCEKWLIALGGQRNVVSAATCAITRIRVILREPDSIDREELLGCGVNAIMLLPGGVIHLLTGFDADKYEAELQQLLKSLDAD
jgi:phosphotransferase system IIB component